MTFRLLVFRPFKGEIITARIDHQDTTGISVSTEFFDDIHVPAELLFPDSVFEPVEGVWVWHNNMSEGEEENQLYFDNGNTVRLRVEAEHWTDQAPDGSEKGKAMDETNGEVVQQSKVPYRIEGSMAESGLGDVNWW